MNNVDRPPHGFDREQTTSTPFLFQSARRKRHSLLKRLMNAIKQRPILLSFVTLSFLCLLGWLFAPSLFGIRPSLDTIAQSRSENRFVAQTPPVVKQSPMPPVTKIVVPASTAPTAPTTTPAMTPQVIPPSLEIKRVNATAPIVVEKGRFALQVGSYQDQTEAAAQLARITGLGIEARMIKVTLLVKGVWHRILVGRFEDRGTAVRFGQRLQSQKAISSFLVTDYQAMPGL